VWALYYLAHYLTTCCAFSRGFGFVGLERIRSTSIALADGKGFGDAAGEDCEPVLAAGSRGRKS
jgi:hypothetical protein